jgi:hypothetical protein
MFLKNYCTPAYVYFIISIIFIIVVAIQNYGTYNNKIYCIGLYQCNDTNITMMFVLKLIYVLFWTFILNLVCKIGSPILSWVLVIFPLVLMGIMLGKMMT